MCIRISKTIILFLLVLMPVFLYAGEEDSIRTAISEKDAEALGKILAEQKELADYAETEEFVLELTKELILEDDYQFAKTVLELLLSNNLENKEAQNLYTSLNQHLREQEKEEELEKQRLEEEERQRLAEEEKTKEIEIQEKLAEIEEKEKEEQIFQEEVENIDIDNFYGSFTLGIGDFSLYSSAIKKNYSGERSLCLKYGISTDIRGWFEHPYIKIGLHIPFDIYFLGLTKTNTTPLSYGFMLSAGTPLIQFPLYVRFGFKHNMYLNNSNNTSDVLITNLTSPTLGIGILELAINDNIELDWALDLFFAAQQSEYVKVIFDTHLQGNYLFYQTELMSLKASATLQSFLIFTEGGMENNTKLELGIRVGFNEN